MNKNFLVNKFYKTEYTYPLITKLVALTFIAHTRCLNWCWICVRMASDMKISLGQSPEVFLEVSH